MHLNGWLRLWVFAAIVWILSVLALALYKISPENTWPTETRKYTVSLSQSSNNHLLDASQINGYTKYKSINFPDGSALHFRNSTTHGEMKKVGDEFESLIFIEQNKIRSKQTKLYLILALLPPVVFGLLLVGGAWVVRGFHGTSASVTPPLDSNAAATLPSDAIDQNNREAISNPAEKYATILYGLLRIARMTCGFFLVVHAVALLSMLLSLGNSPSTSPAEGSDHFALHLFIEIVTTLIFGAAFYGLRLLINRIHFKISNTAHPAMMRNWSL